MLGGSRRHRERSDAIQPRRSRRPLRLADACGEMDRFASLAMTENAETAPC